MKNRIAALILTSAILACNSVYAEPVAKIDGSLVTVTANIEPKSKAMLFAVKAGADINDDSGVIAIRESVSDADGKVVFSFGIPAEKNSLPTDGEYIIYAKQTDKQMKVGSFFYAQPEKRESVLTALENGNVSDTLNDRTNEFALKALGIDMDVYSAFTGDEKTATMNILQTMPDTDCVEAVKKAVMIEMINIDTGDASDMYIKNIDFSFEDTKFEDADDELKDFIASYIYQNRSFESYDEIKNAYDTVNILSVINKTRFTSMESTLSKYAVTLGISNTPEYMRYISCAAKETADKNIVAALLQTPAKSIPELLSVIGKSIPVISDYSSSGGGSSGAGSSSGGGSSSVLAGSSRSDVGLSSTTPSSTVNTPTFFDIANVAWAEEAIVSLAKKGIISGDGDGKFYPMRELTREEFVKMLVTAANLHDKNAECEFDDVGKDKWYYSYVASAVKNGMVSGVSDTEFGSGRPLSRQDMAVMCNRAIKGVKNLDKVRDYTGFEDDNNIKDYAKEPVIELYKSGIINGVDDNSFAPDMGATRAQAAVIIYNLFN